MIVTQDTTQRRGWYHGWNIVALCVLASAVTNGLPVNCFSLFLQDWSTQFHAPISSLQLASAGLGLFSAVFAPFVGVLADKYPARWLMSGGLVGMALFCIGVSYAQSKNQLLALFMIVLPVSVVFATTLTGNAVVSRWFVKRLGLALGLTAFGLGISGVILPPTIAALLPTFGWRHIWRVAGLLIAMVVVPLVILVVKDRPAKRDGTRYVPAGTDPNTRRAHGHGGLLGDSGLSWRAVLGRRNFWLLVAVFLPMLGLYGGCLNNLAPIATNQGLTTQTAGALLSAFSFAHIASNLICGLLSDRFGNRRPLAGLTLTAGLGGVLVALGHGATYLGAGIVLVGLGGGMWPLLAAAVAAEFGAGGVGRAFGLLMMFVPVIVLVPFVVAKVHEITGSYAPSLVGLALLTVTAGAACFLLMRERPSDAGIDPASSSGSAEVAT